MHVPLCNCPHCDLQSLHLRCIIYFFYTTMVSVHKTLQQTSPCYSQAYMQLPGAIILVAAAQHNTQRYCGAAAASAAAARCTILLRR